MKVMLLDPGWPQSGPLMMHLVKEGIEVVRVAKWGFDKIGLGHYCRNIEIPDGCETLEFFADLIRKEPVDLVIPLYEDYQMLLCDLPEDLSVKVFPPISSFQRKAFTDRPTMYRLATKVGVPIPELVELSGRESLQEVAEKFGYPFVLRGTQGIGGVQVKVVNNLEEAETAYETLREISPAEPFAQPFVIGNRCLIGGLFDKGKMLQWYSQMTLESYSPPTGPSVRVKSLRDPKLTGYAENLFRELQWSGLACAEFMRDDQGNFYFLEINPRPWAAIQAAHVWGVPLMAYFAAYLVGKEIPPQKEFKEDQEICLFPQYIIHRLNNKGFYSPEYLRNYLNCLSVAPWRHPYLLFHNLYILRWSKSWGIKSKIKSILNRMGMYVPQSTDPIDVDLDCESLVPAGSDIATAFNLVQDRIPVSEYPWWCKPERVAVTEASPRRLAWLREVAPDVHLFSVNYPLGSQIVDADAVIGWCNADMVRHNPRLKWLQLNTAGIENAERNQLLAERGILVTNLQRAAASAIAEHAVGMLLALVRGLPQYAEVAKKGLWNPCAADLRLMPVLQGRTVLVAGLGGIGGVIAKLLHGLGMKVVAVRKNCADVPEYVNELVPLNQLSERVKSADAVINALPLTDETKGIFSAQMFAEMKNQAFFINVGRGGCVVTSDLVGALNSRQIAGAALDVVDPEPLPRNHPLWRMPNVIVTPHIASRSISARQVEWLVMKENLRRFVAGEPLLSVVDLAKGY